MSETSRQVLREGQLVADDWRYFDEDLGDEDPQAASPAIIIPLSRWQTERAQWEARPGRLGLRIAPADRLETIAADVQRFSLFAIEFPGPGDGRGYTHGRLLRERYGFTGELRAIGYVKRDQLFFLARCGFNAYELSAGLSLEQALAAFKDYDTVYQPAPDSQYGFRRRGVSAPR